MPGGFFVQRPKLFTIAEAARPPAGAARLGVGVSFRLLRGGRSRRRLGLGTGRSGRGSFGWLRIDGEAYLLAHRRTTAGGSFRLLRGLILRERRRCFRLTMIRSLRLELRRNGLGLRLGMARLGRIAIEVESASPPKRTLHCAALTVA